MIAVFVFYHGDISKTILNNTYVYKRKIDLYEIDQ